MKRGRLGDVVRFEGRLAEVIGHSDGRTIVLRYLDNPPCEHCGRADPMPHLVEASRLFQENVEPVTTVTVS